MGPVIVLVAVCLAIMVSPWWLFLLLALILTFHD